MNVYLKNIGIVKESNIVIEGLTVVAGKNNSGKTTVGKVLYALIEAVSNLKEKVAIDRRNYLVKQLRNVEETLEILGLLFRPAFQQVEDHPLKDYAIYRLFSGFRKQAEDNVEKFARQVYDELVNFNVDAIKFPKEAARYFRYFKREDVNDELHFQGLLKRQINEAIELLECAFGNLEKDPDLIMYAKKSIEQTLRVEFSEQIQPVRNPDCKSAIGLTHDGNICFSLELENNRVLEQYDRVFYSTPFKRVYLIDDPFAIDSIPSIPNRRLRISEYTETETIFNTNRVLLHGDKLRRVLHLKEKPSILEMTILEESLRPIREMIDSVLPGQFEFSNEGDYYIQGSTKLQVANLATGSKMFSIIKVLLEMGELDNSTILILDEPEAHLHPQWQNIFAEIVVLLAKELGVKILLTTHSPNFMLAIDAYMRKYDFSDKTNFYQTSVLEDGFVDYQCVNDDLGMIYGDFLQYLSDVKALRDTYLFNVGEDK